MEKEIINFLKKKQIRIDKRKAELEKDKKLNQFLDLLLQYPEALHLLYKLKDKTYPIVLPLQKDIHCKNIKTLFQSKVAKYFYIRKFVYEFLDQYAYFTENPERFTKVIEFLKECRKRGILIEKPEKLFYCQNCDIFILSTKDIKKCECGNEFDIILLLTSFVESVVKSIKLGQMLELLVLKILKKYRYIRLVGYEINNTHIFTSIQYADVGSGEKNNGEFDIVGVSDNVLILVECKFNQTSYSDIRDFLSSADKLYLEVKKKFEDVKILKIIVTYDDSRLEYHNNAVVFSLLRENIKELPKILNSKLSIIKQRM